MKRILITGSNGQLGSELKALSTNYPFVFSFVDVAELDLTGNLAPFFKDNDFDYIVNCAAYTAVDKAEEERELCMKVNADAVGSLASISKEKNIRLIHLSTDYVFNGEFNQPIDESARPDPLSVYGVTKLDGEKRVTQVLDNAYIIRTAWVYSTFGKNFVKTIAGLAREKHELNVVDDQFGSPTYARDLAVAIMTIITSNVDRPGIYHYSNEGAISWYDLAMFINDHYGFDCKIKPIKTSDYKTAAVRPRFSVLDKTKFKKTFGVDIPHWSHSLRECLNKLDI